MLIGAVLIGAMPVGAMPVGAVPVGAVPAVAGATGSRAGGDRTDARDQAAAHAPSLPVAARALAPAAGAPVVATGAARTVTGPWAVGQPFVPLAAGAGRAVADVVVTGTGGPGSARDVAGHVRPAAAGAPVALQRWTPAGWRTVDRGRAGVDGAFTLRLVTGGLGNAQYRVVAPHWLGQPRVASDAIDVGAYGDLRAVLPPDEPCQGAVAFAEPGCENPDLAGRLMPDPRRGVGWHRDTNGAFTCFHGETDVPVERCDYGSTRPDALRVALVGDSHAAMVLPGLRDQAERLNWRLHSYAAARCLLADPGPVDDECHFRRGDLLRRLLGGRYDVVILTGYRQTAAAPDAIALALRRLLGTGAVVTVIGDGPKLDDATLACATNPAATVAQVVACAMPRAAALQPPDPLLAAHAQAPGTVLVDTVDLMCGAADCRPVVGHVMAYRDLHHLSATFGRSILAYRLGPVVAALDARAAGERGIVG
ncbi:SGNH hydrolase domain-containing protein [Cellulomonas uda]|uniref:SGNH hydrolase domain-containing protein n=1 Tax=Cellulomonas uda TaxID=1714 RepID=UPI001141BB1B|nr:SGNH hydrolase domain-containing protein [Cellulomonas uda]NII65308.1 hypothetical protein [Cellulomonas uda]